ncbi:MAG: hypothetical protein U5K71_03330 [Gracilimonas sp.]|nr:hypothetical protein [Gracilimonas sp.]
MKSTEERRLIFYYKVDENGKILSDQMLSVNNRNLHVDRTVEPPLIMMLPYEPEVLVKTDSQGGIYKIDANHFLITGNGWCRGTEIESRYYPLEKHNLIRSEVVESLHGYLHAARAIRRVSLPDEWPSSLPCFDG